MLFQASAVTISGTIHGSSMMPLSRPRKGRRLLRISAIVMPATNLIASDQNVKPIVFCSDSR